MVRTADEVATALDLARNGLSCAEIARRTSIPRRTISDWWTGATPAARKPIDVESLPKPQYAYVLGLYLGDGCISRTGRTQRLRITLDASYPVIIDACRDAVRAVAPGHAVSFVARESRAIDVSCYGNQWLELLPQHGPGRKHERPIVLEPWQRAVVDAFPQEFLRGLIHSDGCRTVNRFKTKLPSGRVAEYAYPRYFFSNMSADIRGLFCEYCDRLGIRWTQSNHRNISVSYRHSVAALDAFIGPKR